MLHPHLEGRIYRLKPSHPKRDFPAFAVGDTYVKGPRGPAGFAIEDSNDIAVTNCVMYSCSGIGFPTDAAERLRIIHFQMKRKEGRPLVVQNGGHNHHNARTGPWVENCLFENTGDDICHVNALVQGIKEVKGPRELLLHGGPRGIKTGDRLQFYDVQEGALLSESAVVSIDPGKRTTLVKLDRDVGPVRADPENGGRKNHTGTQVFNRDRQCNQFVWRNNRSIRGRRIGVLCKGVGGLVEKNLFQQLGGGAVQIWNAPYEELYAEGYVIRDNQMVECGLVRGKGDSKTIWIMNRYGNSLLHRNILIENNVIRDYPCRAMIIQAASEIVIRGNQVSNQKFANFWNDQGGIDIQYCDNLTFQDNTVTDVRELPKGPLKVEHTTHP